MSGENIFWPLVLQLILIIINAIFASAEIAVISMNDNKLAKMASLGDKRAIRLAKLTEQPARFLSTIQVGITLAGFLASAFAADNFSDLLVDWLISLGVSIAPATLDTLVVIVITLILSYFTLVFGELVPKRVAMRKAEELALFISGLIYYVSLLFGPIVWLLTVSTNSLLRLMGIDPYAEDNVITEEEIRMMVDVGEEKGTIDESEKEMINNIFEFDDKIASDIMTHRTDIVGIPISSSLKDIIDLVKTEKYTRYPVYEDSIDNIVGILNVKDLIKLLDDNDQEFNLKDIIRRPYFVPASKN